MSEVDADRSTRSLSGFTSILAVLRVPVWIGACYAVLRTNADPDLWGHVRFGLDLLRSHHLPSIDPYSFASDLAWTNHEWLAELIIGAAYSSMGVAGLILIKTLVTVATFVVIASSLTRAPEPWRWPTAFLVLLGIIPIALTVRPHLWTLLFLTLECRLLSGAPRQRYWLPLIFVLWVNLHGGWIVGLGVLGLWSLMEMFEPASRRPSMWLVLGVSAACAIATLCNPYGWHLWEFLARTVRLSRPNIIEWLPIWRESLGTVILWISGVVWVGVAMRGAQRRPAKVASVVAMLAFASLRVNRLLPLFIPAAVILLLPYVRDVSTVEHRVWPKGRTIVDFEIGRAHV